MRSRRRARSRLWVAISAARPVRRTSSISVSMTPSPVAWSRLPVGSSPSRIFGSLASARTIATRCCSPPESRAGRCAARGASPTPASSAAAFSRARAAAAAGDHLRQHDVFERREFRQQMVELVDKAELASGAARCGARRRGCRNPRRRSAPRRRPAVPAARRRAARSTCRRRTGRPGPRSRPAASARSTPSSTTISAPPLLKTRRTPRSSSAGAASAEPLARFLPRPRGGEGWGEG